MTPAWQEDVKRELKRRSDEKLDLSTEKELALAVGCAQSTMHDLINSDEARYSSLLPEIHRRFGWAEPSEPEAGPPIFSPDALEMAQMYDRLPEDVRKNMRDQAAAILALLGLPQKAP